MKMRFGNRSVNFLFKLGLFFLISSTLVRAQTQSPSISLEYPELLVTPLASERVLMEARGERGRRFTLHLPYQISGLSTFVAGVFQFKNKDKERQNSGTSALVGTLIGATWLGLGIYLGTTGRPYAKGYARLKAQPTGTKRERLAKERMAEEILASQASLAKKLNFYSILSNVGAGVYMLLSADAVTFQHFLNGLSIFAAFTPLLLGHRWIDTYKQQEKYKKKIYGPVVGIGPAKVGGKLAPSLTLSLSF